MAPSRNSRAPAISMGRWRRRTRASVVASRSCSIALASHDAAGFQLESWQGAVRDRRDLHADPHCRAQGFLDATGTVSAVLHFHTNTHAVELAIAEYFDLELLDRKATDNGLDRRGEDVDPADDQHVVEPPEDAALQTHERAAARARSARPPRAVPRAIADERRAQAA